MRFEIIDYKERYFMREKSRADFIIEILDGNIALADPTLISSDSKRPELPGCLVTALAALLFPPCVLKLCLLEFDELVLRLLFCCFCRNLIECQPNWWWCYYLLLNQGAVVMMKR